MIPRRPRPPVFCRADRPGLRVNVPVAQVLTGYDDRRDNVRKDVRGRGISSRSSYFR